METYDVVVVGGGPAGEVVAGRCADGGLSVVVVERELLGGECSYWGCIPSKTLIRPGDVLAAAGRAPGAREAVTGRLDAAAAFERRDYMTNGWRDDGDQRWLAEHGVDLVRGSARLDGERTVLVEGSGPDDGTIRLTARRAVVLATGSRPVLPPVPGLAEALPWDSRDATSAKDVPPRLVVLGGGAVGVELAQAFRRLGAVQVTVLEVAERLLAREEPFAGEDVRRGLEADGVDVRVGIRLQSVRRAGPGAPVEVRLGSGDVVVGDELLVAAGRRVPTEDLGVASIGVAAERFLPVDEQLRVRGAAGGWLYAVGDCNGLAPLTHMGKYHGRVVADVLLGRSVRDRVSRDVVPRVTFTDPQVCAVGPTEAEARERGLPVRVVRCATGEVPGAYTQGVGVDGTSQLVVDAERRVVVGATFTGPGVQELLHSATVAVAGRVPLEDLWHAVPAFPTVSEVWLHLLERCEW